MNFLLFLKQQLCILNYIFLLVGQIVDKLALLGKLNYSIIYIYLSKVMNKEIDCVINMVPLMGKILWINIPLVYTIYMNINM